VATRLQGDVVIDVPASSQVHRQVIRKELESHDIELDPVVRLHFVEVERPVLEDARGDLERLLSALRREWGLEEPYCDVDVVRELSGSLRADSGRVTVAVRDGRRIFAVWPGFRDRALGLAVDVGSTTIAAHLCELATGAVLASAGLMNPQIRFGEDLMSRVSYLMHNHGGGVQLTEAVRGAVGELAEQVAREARVDPRDVLELVVVGNPVMHHLFHGFDPTPLGTAPFTLATNGAVASEAGELGLGVHPRARVYSPPCIAGHVGADAAAVILAEAPYAEDESTLLVDVGTNAEIVLGNRERLLAASSPTGPAFEGAQIGCGQRAAPGAIERVRIDRATLEPRFRVVGCELWSDDPGFAEALADTPISGVCGSGIIEAIAEMFLCGIVDPSGVIDGALAERSPRIVPRGRAFAWVLHEGSPCLEIEQADVRAIQLAKAALYAGARLLMDRLGIDRVDRIRLAGAFGNTIDVRYAMVLGMIPDCDLERVTSAGNAAGTGARIALLSRAKRAEIEERVRMVEKIETAVEPDFQKHFVAAMAIPNAFDPFPSLQKVVDLPVRPPREERPARRRRRR
jgi:uncharacterized 2Fe-2S/4Fe-4S cluster protein (DUF4445 family)